MSSLHRLLVGILSTLFLLISIVTFASAKDLHGNTPLAATPIPTDGTLVSGCIDPAGDVDYVLFPAVSGRRYIIQTSHLSADMDSIIFLFSTDGRTIIAVDDNSGDGVASRIEWTCDKSGTYFAMVRHAQATSGTGCYDLSVSAVQTDDHGDNAITASPVPTNGAPTSGYIEIGGDIDFFLFAAEGGYAYNIETENLSEGMDTVITLFSTNGKEAIATDDNSGTGLASRIDWTAPVSGTYFVSVRDKQVDGTGGYDLAVKRLGYKDDHANESRGASLISPESGVVSGKIEVPEDVDFFSFQAAKEGKYTFLASTNNKGNIDLSLISPDGTSVISEAKSTADAPAKIEWTAAAAGTCYLSVRGVQGYVGQYTLQLGAVLKLVEIGKFNSSGYALDVAVQGHAAYLIVGVQGLLVLDVSNPADPVEIGSHSTRGYAQAIALDKSTAYIADRGEGLLILNVSDPTAPKELSVIDTPGSAQDVALSGHYAYVADFHSGLQVIDVANPEAPKIVGSWETRGYAEGVTIDGSLALVATGDVGLEVIDISDPTHPHGLKTIDLPGEVTDTAVFGKTVYAAAGYRGIQVIDLSDPTHPRVEGEISVQGEVVGLSQEGSVLYAACSSSGLSVYSLANPVSPKLLSLFDTPGSAVRVFASADVAYVADREEGLEIIRLHP